MVYLVSYRIIGVHTYIPPTYTHTQTHAHARARAHTHTHTHTERESERERERDTNSGYLKPKDKLHRQYPILLIISQKAHRL